VITLSTPEEHTLREFVDGRREGATLERVRFGLCSTPASVQRPIKEEDVRWVDVFSAERFHALDCRYGDTCIACGSSGTLNFFYLDTIYSYSLFQCHSTP
jgi:hypothetical protein